MSSLSENAYTIIETTVGVDMKTAASKIALYTVPTGKTFYPIAVVCRDPSLSLAGLTDIDFGTGATANTWRQAVDLSSMTTADTDMMEIRGVDVTKYTSCAAGSVFGAYINTGATAAATAALAVIGFLA